MTILQREKIFSRTRILNRISLLRKNLKSDEISMKIMLRSRIFSSTIISRGRNTPLWWCYLAQVSKLYDFFFNNARKEESNLLSSICIFQTSIIDLSSYFFFTFASINFQEIRENRDPTTDPFVSRSNSFRMKYKSDESRKVINQWRPRSRPEKVSS